MDSIELTLTICGLDCTECTIFQAAEHPEIAQRIANWFRQERGGEVHPEQIRCAGCRGDPAVQWSDNCEIRTCAQARELHSCGACPDFLCPRFDAWTAGDERHAAAVARLRDMRRGILNDSTLVSWLLAARTPSIRYLTLRRLLDRPKVDPEVQAAWQEIMTAGPVPAILAAQTRAGNWAGERGYYTPKYTSTHWSMLLLAEMAADGSDPHLQRGAAFMLAQTRQELEQALERNLYGMSCFWGNLLRYALHSGYVGDARLQTIIVYLAREAANGWKCPINDDAPCAWGAARALFGVAAMPARYHSPPVEKAIQGGLAFLLEGGKLATGDYPAQRVHALWRRLNFPLFYQADVLFTLRVLGELNALNHPGARPALDWLAARRRPDGHWRSASPFRRRTWLDLADREETDRWVSLHAMVVLKQAG